MENIISHIETVEVGSLNPRRRSLKSRPSSSECNSATVRPRAGDCSQSFPAVLRMNVLSLVRFS